jgi:hypothetical protein
MQIGFWPASPPLGPKSNNNSNNNNSNNNNVSKRNIIGPIIIASPA